MISNLIAIFTSLALTTSAKNQHKSSGKTRSYTVPDVGGNKTPGAQVDREYFKQVFGNQLDDHFQQSPIGNLNRRGSPWPWYEDSKVDYKNDRRIHREVKREQEDHQKEYKKQFEENQRLYQENHRVHSETEREMILLNQRSNSSDSKEKNTSMYLLKCKHKVGVGVRKS